MNGQPIEQLRKRLRIILRERPLCGQRRRPPIARTIPRNQGTVFPEAGQQRLEASRIASNPMQQNDGRLVGQARTAHDLDAFDDETLQCAVARGRNGFLNGLRRPGRIHSEKSPPPRGAANCLRK